MFDTDYQWFTGSLLAIRCLSDLSMARFRGAIRIQNCTLAFPKHRLLWIFSRPQTSYGKFSFVK